VTFSGLTWDHPRGFDALAEAARRVSAGRAAPLITWDKQPLEGFESAPITDLTARYDLVVLDHPHIGEAVEAECLRPVDDLFGPAQIADWRARTVGPAFRSYTWEGRQWALPLDVATQVMARRPDRIAAPPADWEDLEALAAEQPVALSLGGPHAFLTLISMAAAEGAVVGGEAMLPDAVALPALARLMRLAARAPAGSATLNPIGLLEAMARGDDIALIPLVFGYVTYARAGAARHRLAFSDSIAAPGGRGGVLGGTGIAVSRRCAPSPALLAHVADLMSEATQTRLFPDFGGQPSARAAWTSPEVNAAWGGFYRDTLRTAETALLRPRFDGFPAFTNAASRYLREALAARAAPEEMLARLRSLWTDSRARCRGPLDDDR
jgi:multiple sugar transport system substrate-binding protein